MTDNLRILLFVYLIALACTSRAEVTENRAISARSLLTGLSTISEKDLKKEKLTRSCSAAVINAVKSSWDQFSGANPEPLSNPQEKGTPPWTCPLRSESASMRAFRVGINSCASTKNGMSCRFALGKYWLSLQKHFATKVSAAPFPDTIAVANAVMPLIYAKTGIKANDSDWKTAVLSADKLKSKYPGSIDLLKMYLQVVMALELQTGAKPTIELNQTLDTAIKLAPYDPDILNVAMYSLMARDRFAEMKELVDGLLKHDPQNGLYHAMNGCLQSRNQNQSDAEKEFLKALELEPNNANHKAALASVKKGGPGCSIVICLEAGVGNFCPDVSK